MDLFDSYNIRNIKDSSGTCDLLEYSKDTGVAAFAVRMEQIDGAPYPDNPVFLQPASTPLSTPLSGISVTGLGYENGKLHVQICYGDIGTTDNHGWIWLQDKNGKKIDCSYDVSFWDSSLTDSYDEYVFELPYEELGNYKIYAEFTNSGLLIEGDWEITFPMEQVK